MKPLLRYIALYLLILAPAHLVQAQTTVDSAILETQTDIRETTEALITLRETLNREREPLARQLSDLQEQVRGQRKQVENIRRQRAQDAAAQATLVRKTRQLEEEHRYIATLFEEYARARGTRINPAEAETFAALRLPAPQPLPPFVAELLTQAETFNQQRYGGDMITGKALDQSGVEHDGHFAIAGPLAWFTSAEPGPTGIALPQPGTLAPQVFTGVSDDERHSISQIVQGKQANLPLDVTQGDAIKIRETNPSLIDHLKTGGFVMLPLAAVAIVAILIVIIKTIELSRIRVALTPAVAAATEALIQGNPDEARQRASTIHAPLKRLIQDAIQHQQAPREHLEEIMHEHILAHLPRLERHLGTLAVLGGIAPLLGLLGTVTGMIHTFRLVTLFGSGDARLLSGGISEALVTTETGLAIAIPVLIAHAVLARRTRNIIARLEQTAISIINDIKLRSSCS